MGSWFVHGFARKELTAEDEDLDAWGGAEVSLWSIDEVCFFFVARNSRKISSCVLLFAPSGVLLPILCHEFF